MSALPVGPLQAPAARGAVAPRPQFLVGVTPGQRIEVRPGEPVYIHLSATVGAGRSIGGLNKRTPFTVTQLAQAPKGAPMIKALHGGAWFKVEVRANAKVGTVDRVAVLVSPVVLNPKPTTEFRFTLVAGAMRYY